MQVAKTLHHHMVAWRKIQRNRKGNWLCACARDLKSICNMYISIYIYTHIFLVSLDIPLCLSISRHVWSNTWSFLLPQIPGILQSWLPAAVRFWAKTIQDSCDESCGIVLRFFVDFAIAGSSVNAKMWGIQTDTTRCSCTWGSLHTQSHESCLKWYAFLAFMIYLLLQPVRHRLEACKIENAGVAANTLRLFC